MTYFIFDKVCIFRPVNLGLINRTSESCHCSLACAGLGDSTDRKYSTNNSGKAPFSCAFFLANSASLQIKGFASWKALSPWWSDVLAYALCPLGGERTVSLWRKQENVMHSFSRAVVTCLPFECHALSWMKLKAKIGACLSKHFSGIFFISSYHYAHNPLFTLIPVMISFIHEGGEGIYLN